MADSGFDDLAILVINDANHAAYIADLEPVRFPVLQDTMEADVFGLYSARGYDLFIIDRIGFIDASLPDTFPIEDHDLIVAALDRLRTP